MIARVFLAFALLFGLIGLDRFASAKRVVIFTHPNVACSASPPTKDTGSGGGNIGVASSASSVAVGGPLVTASTNTLVLATIWDANDTTAGSPPAFNTPTSTSSLSFTKRKAFAWTGSSGRGTGGISQRVNQETWWAVSAGTLAGETVTATTVGGVNADMLAIAVMAFVGVHTASPWDLSVSLPATVNQPETVNLVASGLSITNNGTMGIVNGVNVSNAGGAQLPTPTGWTIWNSVSSSQIFASVYFQSFASAQSGTYNFTETGHQPPFGDSGIIVDALSGC